MASRMVWADSEPRRARRREVEAKARMRGEEVANRFGRVRGAVVDVRCRARSGGVVRSICARNWPELGRAVAARDRSEHLAGGDVDGCVQIGGSRVACSRGVRRSACPGRRGSSWGVSGRGPCRLPTRRDMAITLACAPGHSSCRAVGRHGGKNQTASASFPTRLLNRSVPLAGELMRSIFSGVS